MFQVFRAMSLAALLAAVFIVVLPQASANEYATGVADKFTRGFANTVTGWIELPKEISNTSKESNIGVGLTVGLVKGLMHTVGRTVVGAVELVTFFVPSPEFVAPRYVWSPFEQETTYGAK